MPTLVSDWDQLPLMVPIGLAARAIGVSRSTLYALLDRGDLRDRRVGGRRFITKRELRRFCEGAAA
jgi:excisionase family DNA binding protein